MPPIERKTKFWVERGASAAALCYGASTINYHQIYAHNERPLPPPVSREQIDRVVGCSRFWFSAIRSWLLGRKVRREGARSSIGASHCAFVRSLSSPTPAASVDRDRRDEDGTVSEEGGGDEGSEQPRAKRRRIEDGEGAPSPQDEEYERENDLVDDDISVWLRGDPRLAARLDALLGTVSWRRFALEPAFV